MNLDETSKEEVADVAAMLFNFQLLGPQLLLELAEKYPWLVERAPKRWEMEAVLDLARRGKTVTETDDAYFKLCRELRVHYSFETQVKLWEKGEPCFPLVVEAALSELYRPGVANALGHPEALLRRWEVGMSRPHPDIQQEVVTALRHMIREQREQNDT